MSEFQLTWPLSGTGWADCAVTGRDAKAVTVASFMAAGPRDIADIGYPRPKAAADG